MLALLEHVAGAAHLVLSYLLRCGARSVWCIVWSEHITCLPWHEHVAEAASLVLAYLLRCGKECLVKVLEMSYCVLENVCSWS
mgnify:CR=1 FL=1